MFISRIPGMPVIAVFVCIIGEYAFVSGSNECRLARIISDGSPGATVGGQVFQQQVNRLG